MEVKVNREIRSYTLLLHSKGGKKSRLSGKGSCHVCYRSGLDRCSHHCNLLPLRSGILLFWRQQFSEF